MTWSRFRQGIRAVAIGAGFLAASCTRGEHPDRMRQFLIVLPHAAAVRLSGNAIAYNIDDQYPASATIAALNRALQSSGCERTSVDPFNPEPGLPFNKWIEYTPGPNDAPQLLWTGAWHCIPNDAVIVFAFRTLRPGQASSPTLEIRGAFYPSERVNAIRKSVGRSGSRSLLFGGTGQSTTRSVSFETCSICGLVRKRENGSDWVNLNDSAVASEPHEHHWEEGVTTGLKIRDGEVVLVRRRLDLDAPLFAYGAFVLTDQRFDQPQERTDVKWIFRRDGGSVLNPMQVSEVTSGFGHDQSRITFGPFSIPWSGGEPHVGFLYYARFPGRGGFSDDYELAPTSLKSFDGIDAANPQFTYRFVRPHP